MRAELAGLGLAGVARAVDGDRRDRRRRPLGPDRIDRVAVDRDQLRAGLGAGRGQPLGGGGGMQPGIEAEAVAGFQVLGDPALRRRLDQQLDRPGLAVDLLGRLQRVAAIHEYRGILRQHHGKPRRAGEAGQPGQPLFGGRDIFVLLLVGARHDKAGQLAPRQLFAQRRQPRGERDAAFGFLKRLETGFEHRCCFPTLGVPTIAGNVTEFDENRHERKNPLAIMWMERFAVMQRTSNEMAPGKSQGVYPDSMARGYTDACLYL